MAETDQLRSEQFHLDPTIRTMEQLYRVVAALEEKLTIRLDAMDKAQNLFHENLTRVPTDTDKQIGHLKELMFKVFGEKFSSIETQFRERDERVKQTAQDTKLAVDAALQAAEKAVGKQNESFAMSVDKSEANTTKQIDQQRLIIETTTKALSEKIDTQTRGLGDKVDAQNKGLSDKIDAMEKLMFRTEGRGSGYAASWGIVLGALGAIGILASIVLAIMK